MRVLLPLYLQYTKQPQAMKAPHIDPQDIDTFNGIDFVRNGTPSWDNLWAAFDAVNAERFDSTDRTEAHCHEVWQYTGSGLGEDGVYRHTFRHRMHPSTFGRQYVTIEDQHAFDGEELAGAGY